MKINKNLLLGFLTFMLLLALFWVGCEQSSTEPQNKETNIQFVFDTQSNNFDSPDWISNILHQDDLQKKVLNEQFSSKKLFSKIQAVDEAKVLVLDMTKWENEVEFFEAWESQEQFMLFDTTLWDIERDFWENAVALLQSYTGDFYQYWGEYSLNIEDSVARGSVNVQPGLNYFLVALRENGQTTFWQEVFQIIVEGEENIITVQGESALFIQIYSPEPGSEYLVGQAITFSAFAEDQRNFETIPEENYVWTSSIDGQFGTGSFFTNADLSVGSHTITLTVTTPSGYSGSRQVSITVVQ